MATAGFQPRLSRIFGLSDRANIAVNLAQNTKFTVLIMGHVLLKHTQKRGVFDKATQLGRNENKRDVTLWCRTGLKPLGQESAESQITNGT